MNRRLCLTLAACTVIGLLAPRARGDVKEDIAKAVKLAGSGRGAEARPLLEAALKDGQASRDQRLTCYETLANISYSERKFEEIRSLMKAAFAENPDASPETMAMCQHYVACSFLGEGRRELAIPELQKMVDMAGAKPELQSNRQIDQRLIAELYMALGKYDEALTAVRKSIDDYPRISGRSLGYSQGVLASVQLRRGAFEEAIDAFMLRARAVTHDDQMEWCRRFVGTQIVPALSRPENARFIDPTIEKLGRLIASHADSPPLCEQLQKGVVQLLLRKGDTERALFEARVLFDVCSADTMPEAAKMLTEVLKAADGSVARANAFLSFVKIGRAGPDRTPGTDDDLANPLGEIQPPDAQARDARFSEALGAYADDWRGKLAKATMYRYWGRPEQALVELNGAFAICPMEQQPIQLIVDATAQVLVQVSGDPDMARKFTEFQQLGPAGADGKKGTPDDLTNPITSYLPKE